MKIRLRNSNKKILVDKKDYPLVGNQIWSLVSDRDQNFYAVNGRGIKMHRILMGCQKNDGKLVDHINRNGLDNRRVNLRLATHRQNMRNRRDNRKGNLRRIYQLPNGSYMVLLQVGTYKRTKDAIKKRDWAEDRLGLS